VELFGFRRENGDIGIRNYIAIIAAMDNSIPVVRRIAQAVTGAISITPSFGANMLAHDYKQHLNTLIGLGTNPNVFGAVVISQDLESSEAVTKEIIKTGRPGQIQR
jgi:altronate dehydratase